MANDTSSLCLHKPEKEFNIRVFRDLNELLEMIILSTDGYANSFSDEASFKKVGEDFVKMKEEDGISVIDECLKDWLEETTRLGSGDDISYLFFVEREIFNISERTTMYDYHLHSNFSGDCHEAMEDVIIQGVLLKGKELCFTDHLDYDYPTDDVDFQFDQEGFEKSFYNLKKNIKIKSTLRRALNLAYKSICQRFAMRL